MFCYVLEYIKIFPPIFPPIPVFLYSYSNIRISLFFSFWILVLALLPHCYKFSRPYLVPVLAPVPTWTKTLRKSFFLVKSLQNGIYDNIFHRDATVTRLDHMTTTTIYFKSSNKFFGDVMNIHYDVITFVSEYSYFKEGWSSQFCWRHQEWENAD